MDLQFFGGDEESGKVFVVETKADAGYTLESHKHEHAHTSILVSGTADVTIDGVTQRYTGYNLLTVPKNTMHTVVAVTDIIWLCLWADDKLCNEQAKSALELVKNLNELEA
jgi:quercetin dioxygenase-like cupin family protein